MKRFIALSILAIAVNGYCDSTTDEFSRKLVETRGGEMVYSDHLVCTRVRPDATNYTVSYLVQATAPADENISEDVFVSRVVGISVRMFNDNINAAGTKCVPVAELGEPADVTLSIQISREGYSLNMSESGENVYHHSALWEFHQITP